MKQEERGPKETLQRMRHKMGRFENISRSTKEELKHNGENLRETGQKGKAYGGAAALKRDGGFKLQGGRN